MLLLAIIQMVIGCLRDVTKMEKNVSLCGSVMRLEVWCTMNTSQSAALIHTYLKIEKMC